MWSVVQLLKILEGVVYELYELCKIDISYILVTFTKKCIKTEFSRLTFIFSA